MLKMMDKKIITIFRLKNFAFLDLCSMQLRKFVLFHLKNYFSYFSTKTYVVGTQKKRLIETVLLSTHSNFKTDG